MIFPCFREIHNESYSFCLNSLIAQLALFRQDLNTERKVGKLVWFSFIVSSKVSVQGVKSPGGHYACLCQGFEFYEVKFFFVIIFQKDKSKIAQIYYYVPQSARINLQSPQSDSTPWTLTLGHPLFLRFN